MCDTFEEEHTTALFLQRFKTATDMWNAARTAIEQEYPASVNAQQLPVIE
jgi:hypothetical protein